jgi:alpha,alpha-trehalose phosphorylase
VHHGDPFTVAPGAPVIRPVPPLTSREAPTQPPGRTPTRRRTPQ